MTKQTSILSFKKTCLAPFFIISTRNTYDDDESNERKECGGSYYQKFVKVYVSFMARFKRKREEENIITRNNLHTVVDTIVTHQKKVK